MALQYVLFRLCSTKTHVMVEGPMQMGDCSQFTSSVPRLTHPGGLDAFCNSFMQTGHLFIVQTKSP